MPELRRPTDRAEAWAGWRARIARGADARQITSIPECGLYRAKRRGQYVAVQIDLATPALDDDGYLAEPERFVAFVGRDVFYEQAKIEEIWLRCAASPITEEQFERLLKAPEVTDLSRNAIV